MQASTHRVAQSNDAAIQHYKAMRSSLMDIPGLDRTLCEIVVTSQLALLGHEIPFKLHAMRLFELKVTRATLEQVILAGVGVTFVLPQAAQALDWIADAEAQFMKTAGAPGRS